MKDKTINIHPGDILLYKKRNLLKELWYHIRKKDLPFNKINIWSTFITIPDPDNGSLMVLTPKKRYNNKEIAKLSKWLQENRLNYKQLDLVIKAVNAIRPNTFSENATIEDIMNSSYYKTV